MIPASDDPSADCTFTLQEYVQEQQRLEEAAKELLPGRFDKCTYGHGHAYQSIFVCMTCSTDKSRPLSVCYGCSISCHTSCTLIELGARRDIRCDCGNSSARKKCSLYAGKEPVNAGNDYSSHNFQGHFCVCNEFYDEEGDDTERTMYQCVACQDWLHDTCIIDFPEPASFEEFICSQCSPQLEAILRADGDLVVQRSGSLYLKTDWRKQVTSLTDHEIRKRCAYLFEKPELLEPEPDDFTPAKSPSLDPITMNKGIMAYAHLREKLKSFVDSRGDSVVTKEDVDTFIATLKVR